MGQKGVAEWRPLAHSAAHSAPRHYRARRHFLCGPFLALTGFFITFSLKWLIIFIYNTIREAVSRDTSSSQHAGHAARRNRMRSVRAA